MKRINDVKDKLNFVAQKRQELSKLLFEHGINKQRLEQVGHIVANILGDSTKCLDYLACDIAENILPTDPKQRRIYFPFYHSQLKKYPWIALQSNRLDLYNFLRDLTINFDQNNEIPNTLFKYSSVRHIRELVNSEKHDKIIEIDSGAEELFIDMGGFKAVLPLNQPFISKGPQQWKKSSNVKTVVGCAYVIAATRERVDDICLVAEKATGLIVGDIYRIAFGHF